MYQPANMESNKHSYQLMKCAVADASVKYQTQAVCAKMRTTNYGQRQTQYTQ